MAENKASSVKNGWVTNDIKLTGKTVIVTGCNTGIGLATAIDMAKREAKVIMACRNMEKAEVAKQQIVEESKSDKVFIKQLDLGSLKSVRKFAEDINNSEERLDILINNAGIMRCPQGKTEDGFEKQMGTNHLGHFLLTNLLLDLLKKSSPSRVVVLSSLVSEKSYIKDIQWDDINSEKDYGEWKAYFHSKLMNVMFAKELSNRYKDDGVTAYSVHPGAVKTDLQKYWIESGNFITKWIYSMARKWLFTSPAKGAQTSIYCAVAPEALENIGGYFKDCKAAPNAMNPAAKDPEKTKRLWEISEEMVGLKTKEEHGEQNEEAESEEQKQDNQEKAEVPLKEEIQENKEQDSKPNQM